MNSISIADRVRTVVGIVAIFIALVGGILLIQREVTSKIVEIRGVPGAISSGVKVNDIRVDDSGQTQMRYYENKSSTELLIFFHGAGGSDNEKPQTASNFVNVLAPTYVTNTISPIPLYDQQLYDVVDASMEEALGKGFEYQDILVMGFSVGGAQAVYAAAQYPDLKIVIPIGTFTSFRDTCVSLIGGGVSTCTIIPEDYLLSEAIAAEARAPIHQYDSLDDKVIDISNGRKLFAFFGSEQKQFTEIRGEHSDFDIVQILNDNL